MIKPKFGNLHVSFLKIIEDQPLTTLKRIRKILSREELTIGSDKKIINDLIKAKYIVMEHFMFQITNAGQQYLAKILSDKEYVKTHLRFVPGNCEICGKFEYELVLFKKQFQCSDCLNSEDPESESCISSPYSTISSIHLFQTSF